MKKYWKLNEKKEKRTAEGKKLVKGKEKRERISRR